MKTRTDYVDGTWAGSIDFLHKLCNKALVRCKRLGLDFEYDDLFQEASMAFVLAQRSFKPEMNFKFITYLGSVAGRRLNKLICEAMNKKLAMPLCSMDDDHGSDTEMHSFISDESPGAEQLVAQEQEFALVIEKLSPLSRKVVELTISPTPEIEEEFAALKLQCKTEREKYGSSRIPPAELGYRFILNYFLPKMVRISAEEHELANAEIKRLIQNGECRAC